MCIINACHHEVAFTLSFQLFFKEYWNNSLWVIPSTTQLQGQLFLCLVSCARPWNFAKMTVLPGINCLKLLTERWLCLRTEVTLSNATHTRFSWSWHELPQGFTNIILFSTINTLLKLNLSCINQLELWYLGFLHSCPLGSLSEYINNLKSSGFALKPLLSAYTAFVLKLANKMALLANKKYLFIDKGNKPLPL